MEKAMSDNIYYGIHRTEDGEGVEEESYFTINEYYIAEAIEVRDHHQDEQDMFINGVIRAHRYTKQGIDLTDFLKDLMSQGKQRPFKQLEKYGVFRLDCTFDTYIIADTKLKAVCALSGLEDGWEKDV